MPPDLQSGAAASGRRAAAVGSAGQLTSRLARRSGGGLQGVTHVVQTYLLVRDVNCRLDFFPTHRRPPSLCLRASSNSGETLSGRRIAFAALAVGVDAFDADRPTAYAAAATVTPTDIAPAIATAAFAVPSVP